MTLTGSTEVGISIQLHHCTQTPCEDIGIWLGNLLYAGPYNPQFGPGFFGEPQQNFTVTIPDSFPSGPALLSVGHANVVGVSTIY